MLLAPPSDVSHRYNLACAMSLLGESDRSIDLLESIWGRSNASHDLDQD